MNHENDFSIQFSNSDNNNRRLIMTRVIKEEAQWAVVVSKIRLVLSELSTSGLTGATVVVTSLPLTVKIAEEFRFCLS